MAIKRSAAVVAMVLLAAMLLIGEAEAGRRHRDRRHRHHSPPAPPGFDEAPGSPFRGEPSASPPDAYFGDEPSATPPDAYFGGEPFASPSDGVPFAPEAGGPEGSPSRRLSENFADAPFAEGPSFFAEGPDTGCPPEDHNPERMLTDFADAPLADSFADAPFSSGEGGPAPESGC